VRIYAVHTTLAAKLNEELNYEIEENGADAKEAPEFLKAFQDQGVWTVRLSTFSSFAG